MACPICGGDIIGNGYTSVMHCENANDVAYELHEPDANPVYCCSAEEELERSVFNLWETGIGWNEIAQKLHRPLSILLSYKGIIELYLK